MIETGLEPCLHLGRSRPYFAAPDLVEGFVDGRHVDELDLTHDRFGKIRFDVFTVSARKDDPGDQGRN